MTGRNAKILELLSVEIFYMLNFSMGEGVRGSSAPTFSEELWIVMSSEG